MKKGIKKVARTIALILTLCATGGAWAAAPAASAVWESGQFEDVASLHGGYSISLNGNTVNSDGNIVIGDSSGAGATIAITDVVSGGASAMTVLYKYKTVGASGGAKFFVSTYLRSSDGTAGEDIGAICWSGADYRWVFAAQLSSGTWKNWRDSNWNTGSVHDNALSTDGGYVAFSFQTADKARAYTGSSLNSLAGFYKDGTTYSSSTYNGTMSHIGIGGPTGFATGEGYYGQWPGIVIEKVAIFIGNAFSDTELSEYKWPSECDGEEVKTALAQWIDAGYNSQIRAWRDTTHSAFYQSTFSIIDKSTGEIGAPKDLGSNEYLQFVEDNGAYTAPGHVLWYDAPYCTRSSNADFRPIAFGGMYVSATPNPNGSNYYEITGSSANSGYRTTTLGKTDYTTYFKYDKSFKINRTDNVTIKGTVNLSVANGETFYCNSDQSTKSTVLESNAKLKVSGEGNMAVATLDASNGTLDFTGLSTRSAALPFITGTVQLGENTKIVLPAGTTSPYKIATTVSGSSSLITIGDKSYPVTVAAGENAGEIEWEIPTIDVADDDYTIETVFGSVESSGDYSLKVEQNATLDIGSSTVGTITIDVDEGKTLTLSGTSLTATTINLIGKGVVKVTAAGALKGTVTGDGTLLYTKSTSEATNVIPTIGSAGISLAPSWNGTLWLKDITGSSYNSSAGGNRVSTGLTDMANYGVSGSKVKFTNVHAWCNNISVPWTLVLEDGESEDEVAWENDNGSTGNKTVGITIAALEGDGTFCDNYDSCYPYLKFTSVENFRGSIVSKGKRILLGNATIGSVGAGSRGSFTVGSDITATIATGKKWSSGGVFTINGNITNNGTIETTGTGTGSNAGKARPDTDSNNYSQVPNVVVSGVLTNAGTITIPSVASVSVSGTANYEASVSGATTVNGGTLNVMANTSGAITVNNGGVVNTSGNISLSGSNVVNAGGTLNVESGNATLTTSDRGISGTVNIAYGATLTANTDDSMNYNSDGSGTINVYGTLATGTFRWTLGSGNLVRVYNGGVLNGTDAMALHFNTGSANIRVSKIGEEAAGTATINCPIYLESGDGGTITVDDGMTLVLTANAFAGSADKRMTKAGEGCLKFQRADSGTTYVPTISAGTIEIADDWTYDFGNLRDFSCVTVASGSSPTLKVRQTTQEVGSAGEIVISNIDSSITSITVIRPDGTEPAHTPEDGSITITESDTVVGTVACWHDWEFEGNVNDAVSSDPKNLATSWGETSGIYSYEDGESGNQVMKLTQRGGNSSVNYPTEWSAAMRCKMPSAGNKWVIAFGTTSGAIGLASGETTGDVMLVSSTSTSDWESLADMSVGSPTTAFHVYVFVKTADTVSTYCDGALIDRRPFSGAVGNGFQIGTRLGNAAPLGQATDGQIDYLRLYDYVLSDDQIAKLTSDNPYISTTPVFTRDMAGDQWWYTGAATWTKSDSTTAQYPAAGSIVEVTATDDASVTMNLPETTVFEKLTFKGEGSVTLIKNNDRPLSAAELEVKTDVTVPYALAGFTGTRVSVDEGKVLTFDFSSYDYSSVTTTTTIPVTGIVAARGDDSSYDSRLAVYTQSLPNYITSVTIEYDEDAYNYVVIITPDHDVGGEIYWREGTYWSADNDNSAVFYTDAEGSDITSYRTGDILVIPDNSTRWYGPVSDGARLKFDCGGTVTIKKTGSLGYAFKNATITVESGTTLDFQKDGYSTNPEVYGGVISGAGSVSVGSGITLDMTNGAMVSASVNGAGVVSFDTLPTSALSLGSWTGTVVLPSFTASSGWSLNDYGKSGSTVEILGISGGWISEAGRTVAPTLKLTGNIVIGAMSSWTYSFSEITGGGNLSFATTGSQPSSVTISKVAEGYTGTISSTLTTPVTIGELKLSSLPACDQKILSVGGTGSSISLDISKIKVGESPLPAKYKVERRPEGAEGDGFYIYYYGTIFSVY